MFCLWVLIVITAIIGVDCTITVKLYYVFMIYNYQYLLYIIIPRIISVQNVAVWPTEYSTVVVILYYYWTTIFDALITDNWLPITIDTYSYGIMYLCV